MKLWVKVVLTLAAAGLILVVCGFVLVWKRPLAVYAWKGRRELVSAGFVKRMVPSAAGEQCVFTAGSGPTLVLLHGAGAHAGSFAKIAPALASSHRVVIPDLAGHGDSAPATGPIPMETVVAGLEGALAAEAPSGRLTIVGNSMGAWMAGLWGKDHPDRVERLVFVNGGPVAHVSPGLTLQPKSREEARKTMDALMDPSSPRVPDFVLDDVVRESGVGPLGRLFQGSASMGRFVLDGHLDTLNVPVELLWGASDRMVPLEYAQKMAAQLPAARLTTMERCGHVPGAECPERFTAALLDLLAKDPPAAMAQADAGAAGTPQEPAR